MVGLALVAVVATSCASGPSRSTAQESPSASQSSAASAAPESTDESQASQVVTSVAPASPSQASSYPRRNGLVAVWNMCDRPGPTRIVDPMNGAVVGTVGLHGRPTWSPDARRLAALDNFDGAVRVAELATGVVRVVANLQIPPYSGDSCGTSGSVLWSRDGTSL